MRQIKFRGKDVRTGEWITGFYIHFHDPLRNRDDHRMSTGIADSIPDTEGYYYCAEYRDVDPETVGEFTGFTDADGRDIYDGDIIQVNGQPYHLVRWLDELGGFGTCNLCTMRSLEDWPDRCLFGIPAQDWWRDFGREIEVVGNVHDNPDYLERFREE